MCIGVIKALQAARTTHNAHYPLVQSPGHLSCRKQSYLRKSFAPFAACDSTFCSEQRNLNARHRTLMKADISPSQPSTIRPGVSPRLLSYSSWVCGSLESSIAKMAGSSLRLQQRHQHSEQPVIHVSNFSLLCRYIVLVKILPGR